MKSPTMWIPLVNYHLTGTVTGPVLRYRMMPLYDVLSMYARCTVTSPRMVIKTPYVLKTTLRTFEFSFYSYRHAKAWLKTSVEGAGMQPQLVFGNRLPLFGDNTNLETPDLPICRTRGISISQMPSYLWSRRRRDRPGS
jgi:hypothetical protein